MIASMKHLGELTELQDLTLSNDFFGPDDVVDAPFLKLKTLELSCLRPANVISLPLLEKLSVSIFWKLTSGPVSLNLSAFPKLQVLSYMFGHPRSLKFEKKDDVILKQLHEFRCDGELEEEHMQALLEAPHLKQLCWVSQTLTTPHPLCSFNICFSFGFDFRSK
jgi:hypothetical protein